MLQKSITNLHLFLAIVVLGMVGSGTESIASSSQISKPTVIVANTTSAVSNARLARFSYAAEEIRSSIETQLRASRRFAMLERNKQNLDLAFAEQDLESSDFSNTNNAGAGEIAGAKYIIVPKIKDIRMGASFSDLDGFPGRYKRTDFASLTVSIQVIDSASGELNFATEDRSSYRNVVDVVEGKTGGPGSSVMRRLVKKTGIVLGSAIVDSVFPIMVAQVQANEVFLNRGGDSLSVGDEFEVYAQGAALIDPITGAPLGGFGSNAETWVGRIRIVRVAPRFSVASIQKGKAAEFSIGAIARHKQ
jgi:hypothetical protein